MEATVLSGWWRWHYVERWPAGGFWKKNVKSILKRQEVYDGNDAHIS